jgi:hypothetical protein
MTAGAAPATADRSDFRHVLVSGTKVGVAIAAAVIVYLLASRYLPAGVVLSVVQAAIVLAAGVAASFLPAHWTAARSVQGVAGAAAVGLWGTIVFMAIDIVLFRPFKAYPWTWDAIGGGSTWWYLPIWWMLGTYAAWMGAWFRAAREARGKPTTIPSLALSALLAAIGMTIGLMLGFRMLLPVAAGASYAVMLSVLAIIANARRA